MTVTACKPGFWHYRGATVASPKRLEDSLRQLQKGSAQSLEAVIGHTQAQAYRLAYAILQDGHLAQDVLQEVYLTVFEKISQLRQVEAFLGWFRRILVHTCQRHLRRMPQEWLEDRPETELPSQPAVHHEVHGRLGVQEILSRLNPAERTALALREVLQLSYEEIAATLELPLTTVRMRIYKARQRLLDGEKR